MKDRAIEFRFDGIVKVGKTDRVSKATCKAVAKAVLEGDGKIKGLRTADQHIRLTWLTVIDRAGKTYGVLVEGSRDEVAFIWELTYGEGAEPGYDVSTTYTVSRDGRTWGYDYADISYERS